MSKIDYQALREAAQLATQGEWVAFISSGTGTYAVHTPGDKRCEDVIKWTGFDGQNNAENNARYIAAFNPEVVQALLDERERNQQYIKLREPRLHIKEPGNSPVIPDDLSTVCAEAYQVVGVMADALGVFGDAAVQKVLDNLSQQKLVHRDVLPFSLPVTPDGWISCSERMPEETKMLLAFSQGEIVAAYWNWVVNPIDYKKYRAFTYLSGNILDDVTHWMPLPEPPQEVNRG
ncbi:TPA: ead/Ea22-like family protein [Escherichia coli]|nr:ead/Ea22-like family protein [Escherichia coli]